MRQTTRPARSSRPVAENAESDVGSALLDALRAVGRELRVAEREAEQQVGLPPAQVHTLRQLGERPAASLAELAERTHTDPSSASIVVQRLVERGLVARTAASDDRRRTELAVTSAGRAVLRRAPFSAADRVAEALAEIGPQRAATLTRGLEALARALRTAGEDESEN